ncbi:hypothetical protein [Granulicella tundricola]|uniref:hypothetical protein n=1 Tax=Granulicella tundricola TaxID=940615 RepID=UPI0003192A94|nr:hypothetical protein [Granulicella tundricola]
MLSSTGISLEGISIASRVPDRRQTLPGGKTLPVAEVLSPLLRHIGDSADSLVHSYILPPWGFIRAHRH